MTIEIDAQHFARRVLRSREALTKKHGMLLLSNTTRKHTKLLYQLYSFYVELSYDKKMNLIAAQVVVARLAKRKVRYNLKNKRYKPVDVPLEINNSPLGFYGVYGMN